MNKVLFYLRRSLIPVVAVVSAGVLFTACLKDKDNGPDIPAAGLMAFNLAPDQSSLVIRLSGNSLTQAPLDYTSYTGVYQNIYTGSRPVEAYDYRSGIKLTNTNYTFEANKYYSLFVIGADSAYRNIVSVDNFDSLTTTDGKAYVRYINAITDSVNNSTVTVTAGGSNVVNDNAAYGVVSEFKAVTPGQVSITVKNNNGVDANRTITLEQKKVYTILLAGKPGATNENQKVQIRFITNGTVTDDASKQ